MKFSVCTGSVTGLLPNQSFTFDLNLKFGACSVFIPYYSVTCKWSKMSCDFAFFKSFEPRDSSAVYFLFKPEHVFSNLQMCLAQEID